MTGRCRPRRLFAFVVTIAMLAGRVSAGEVSVIGPAGTSPTAGKEADAIPGDILIRNDKVAAAIGGASPVREANVNTQAVQGAVLDLVRIDRPGPNGDLLTAYYPQGHYLDAPGPTRVEIVRTSGPDVAVRFVRAAAPKMQGDPVDVETEYSLRDGEPFLRIVTTYHNRAAKPANAAIYDKIRADGLFTIPPAGDAPFWIYDDPWNVGAYGVVRAGGGKIRSYANPASKTYFLPGGNRLDFPELSTPGASPLGEALPAPSSVPAGGAIVLERFLIPGRHVADVQAVVARLIDAPATAAPVRLVDPDGRPAVGASIRASRDGKVVSEGRTDADGRIDLILDGPGTYELVAADAGRAEVRSRLEVPAGKEGVTAEVAVGPRSFVAFDVVDGSRNGGRGPTKAVLRGVDGTPNPNLGPDAMPRRAGQVCTSPDGRFEVPLPPGSYEALIGRGPEYELETRRFRVGYGEPARVEASLRRAFETPGWIIADFHNHTTASNDSIAETNGRVVGIAAAGIEFAPATEHNRISTFAGPIAAQGLAPFLASTESIELSGRPGPGATNHQIAFPLKLRQGEQSGGAPKTDRDPKVQIGRLFHHDDDAEKFVQQNHPEVGWLYFDKDRDGKADGGFGTRPFTHAMELNRAVVDVLKDLAKDDPAARRSRGFHWLQMLNQGDRIFATANSDAHATGFHDGSIFTYVRVDRDSPPEIDPMAVARAAKAGRMILSNGPFLEVALDGVAPGGEVRLARGLTLTIRVATASWIDVDRVQVLVNGKPDPRWNWTRDDTPETFAANHGPVRFERKVPVELSSDAHLIVVATGERSKLGPFHGPSYGVQPPTALSNPIFVDVDGGGFIANRDTLGAPLPNGVRDPNAPREAE